MPARIRATVLVCLSLALAAHVARAAEPPSGRWKGAIEVPGTALEVVVDLESSDGSWTGAIDIPAQGATDLPLTGITVEGRAVSFAIRGVPGEPTFRGDLSDDGGQLAGTFTQGGASFPFALERSGDAALARPPVAPATAADLRAFIEDSRETWDVPGVAVTVIRDGEVFLAEGFGLRNVEQKLPVTADTLFAIGSSTKAFTSFVLGTLVDEGKLDWNEPVRTYLPSFQLQDPVASLRLTPKDLLIHDSGLPRHDLVWYGAAVDRASLFERLRHLEPTADLRTRFQYQNLMYMTAGHLAGQVAGSSWEELVSGRVLDPLGMRATTLGIEGLRGARDRAIGYKEKDDDEGGGIEVAPYRDLDAMAPAGSINSNARDMARWVQLQLGKGEIDGKRLVSEAVATTMHSPHIVVDQGIFAALLQQKEMPYVMYGLGWFVQPYRGHRMVHHGGNIDGFSALVSFLPDDDMGVVVLTNMNGTLLTQVVALGVYDRLLGLEPVDWSTRYQGVRAQIEQAEEQGKAIADIARKEGTRPSHPLDELVADYAHPAYGTLTVSRRDDGLAMRLNALSSPLEHWHYDQFRATEEPAEGIQLAFRTNLRGDVGSVETVLEQGVAPIVFDRLPPAEMSEPSFLLRFVGDYSLMGLTLTAALRGDRLTVTIPGQPTYTLVPYRGTEFELEGQEGFSVRFETEGDRVTEAIFIQPNGVFRAERKNRER